jgi:hypothetical protein
MDAARAHMLDAGRLLAYAASLRCPDCAMATYPCHHGKYACAQGRPE